MESKVLGNVLEKCKLAMLSGIPIVYIVTDSDVLIHQLVMEEKKPLVVLTQKGRPYYEAPAKERVQGMIDNLYECSDVTLHTPIELSIADASSRNSMFILTCRMPDASDPYKKKEAEKIFNALGNYVMRHEDENAPNYAMLQSSLIVLYSSEVFLTPMLQTYTEVIYPGYPKEGEIQSVLRREMGSDIECFFARGKDGSVDEKLASFSQEMLGFTVEEVVQTAKQCLVENQINAFDGTDKRLQRALKIVRSRKEQKLHGGLLELLSYDDEKIGGMENFKSWLETQKDPIENYGEYVRKVGVYPPKGVLLCGVPGCGKTLAAKFVAQEFGRPIFKMDIGSLMDKWVGSSEAKMREALKLAETMSPCVLLIDELEKGFSGAKSSDQSDSGGFKRMFAYLLGWMQDNRYPCFIVATANDISGLPKEFFRSGRFDKLYAVYLPTAEECADIFMSCVKKAIQTVKRRIEEENEYRISSDKADVQHLLFYPEADSDEEKDIRSEKKFYLSVINDALIKDGNLKIVVGSDIQKAVDITLRKFKSRMSGDYYISREEWKTELTQTLLHDLEAYGSNAENLDAIALSYCRMLRKGFDATTKNPLFSPMDYDASQVKKKQKCEKEISMCSDPETRGALVEEFLHSDKYSVMKKRFNAKHPYDEAVYNLLLEKINEVAYELESYEHEAMIRR